LNKKKDRFYSSTTIHLGHAERDILEHFRVKMGNSYSQTMKEGLHHLYNLYSTMKIEYYEKEILK